jgi:phosphohistidine phosphatase SixA
MTSGPSGAGLHRRGLLLGLAAAVSARPAGAAPVPLPHPPSQVWLIRHAEQADDPGSPSLSSRGLERARAIAQAFPVRFKPIGGIFAAQPVSASYWAVETVLPLYNALALASDEPPPFTAVTPDAQARQLATRILSDAKWADDTVFICWHHDHLPSLARALAAGRTVVDGAGRAHAPDGKPYRIPGSWDRPVGGAARRSGRRAKPTDSEVFDRVWQLRFRPDGTVAFVDLPQRLLSGDSADTRGPAT